MITEAAAALYPAIWGGKKGDFSTSGAKSSTAGAATVASNGDCGWGYPAPGNWKDPGGTTCVGYYAYNDDSADQGTLIVEGVYWAIVTYIGGLYTTHIAADIKDEWLMVAPDDGMVSPSSSPSPSPCPYPNPKPNPNPTVTRAPTLTLTGCSADGVAERQVHAVGGAGLLQPCQGHDEPGPPMDPIDLP